MTTTEAQGNESSQILSIYIAERDKWRGQPLHEAILQTLRAEGIAGATVLRGIMGYGAHRKIRSGSIWPWAQDHPVCIQVVDQPDRIAHAAELIGQMVTEGLVTVKDVQTAKPEEPAPRR
jgi:hypothetical protein